MIHSKLIRKGLFVLFLLNAFTSSGQSLEWVFPIMGPYTFNGNSPSSIRDVQVNNQNLYVSGGFRGTVDFDPLFGDSTAVISGTLGGSYENVAASYSLNGQINWVLAKPTGYTSTGTGVYAHGGHNSQSYFGGVGPSLSKQDSLGNTLWQYIGAGGASYREIAVKAGIISTVGSFLGTVDLDIKNNLGFDLSNQNKYADNFIAIYDTSGSCLSANQFSRNGDQLDQIADFKQVDSTQYIVGGGYSSNFRYTSVGGINGSLNGAGGAVLRLDTAGEVHWIKEFEGATVRDFDFQDSILVIALSFSDSIRIDSSGFQKTFYGNAVVYSGLIVTLKLQTGGFVSARLIDGPWASIPSAIEMDELGNIYTGGAFGDEMYFETLTGLDTIRYVGGNAVNYNAFVAKMNSSLEGYWIRNIPVITPSSSGSSTAFVWDLELDSNWDVLISGIFRGAVDFGLSDTAYVISSANNGDLQCSFLMKINQCTKPSSTAYISSCDSALLPTGQYVYQDGEHSYNFPSPEGCDSVHTVVVDVYHSLSDSVSLSGCDAVTLNGISYTTSGNFSQVLQTTDGCDSIVYISSIVEYSDSTFIQTSECDSILIEGQYIHTDGLYPYYLTNSVGCDSSVVYDVTIHDSEVITTEPMDYLWSLGSDTASFEVMAFGAQGYQWAANDGTGWTSLIDAGAFDGTTTAELRITSFTPQDYHNHLFRCYVTSIEGCIDTSANARMTVSVGLDEPNPSLQIYPNPATQVVYVDGVDYLEYRVLNQQGQLVSEGVYVENEGIDIEHLSSGTYVIRMIVSNNQIIEGSFIKP